jgi:hypothetical protein
MAVPLGSVGQAVQLAPQAVASSLAAQRSPQRWYAPPHAKSQVPLAVHDVPVAPVGLGQALQFIPHELVLVLSTQTPLQLCVPLGHWPAQACVAGMQVPLHRIWLAAHWPPHLVPSHVDWPFVMSGQAVHDDDPHEPTSLLLTHLLPHGW